MHLPIIIAFFAVGRFAHPGHLENIPVPLLITDGPYANLSETQQLDLEKIKHFHTHLHFSGDPIFEDIIHETISDSSYSEFTSAGSTLVSRYHLGDDTNHCWLNGTLIDCPYHFDVQWLVEPPQVLHSGQVIDVKYSLLLGNIITTGPTMIVHANLHACPTDIGFCAITIKNGTHSMSGAIVTQEAAQASNTTLIHSQLHLAEGSWCIINHVRVFTLIDNHKTQLDIARARYRTVLRSACQPGQFRTNSLNETNANCAQCSTGTFSNTTNAIQCTQCPPGFYQAGLGASSCIPCPSGYISTVQGSAQCGACPGFTYSDGTGTNCVLCPHGSYSVGAAKSVNECFCQSGYLNISNTCFPCPNNGICCSCNQDLNISWSIIQKNIDSNADPCTSCINGSMTAMPLPGFYLSRETSMGFYTCDPPDSCLGGPFNALSCATGYIGERCGQCAQGHYKTVQGKCTLCGSTWIPVATFLVFMVAVAFVLGLTLIFVMMEEGTDVGTALLTYFQILDLTRRTRTIWPSMTAQILYISALFNLDLTYFRLECVMSVPYAVQQVLWITSPIFVLLTLLAFAGIMIILRAQYKHLRANPPIKWGETIPYMDFAIKPYPFKWSRPFAKLFEIPDKEFSRVIYSWIIFCAFPIYPMMVSRSLLYFNCGLVMNQDGFQVQFLKELPQIKCGDSTYMSMSGISIAGLVVWCILPPVVNAIFIANAHRQGWTKEPVFYQTYWPLYKPYVSENIIWLSVNLFFTCLFHATTVVFKNTADQMTAGSIVMLLEMALVAWRRPWHQETVAFLDLIQHGSILVFLMIARNIDGDHGVEGYDAALSGIVIATVAILLFLMGWMFAHPFAPEIIKLPKSLQKKTGRGSFSTVDQDENGYEKSSQMQSEQKSPLMSPMGDMRDIKVQSVGRTVSVNTKRKPSVA